MGQLFKKGCPFFHPYAFFCRNDISRKRIVTEALPPPFSKKTILSAGNFGGYTLPLRQKSFLPLPQPAPALYAYLSGQVTLSACFVSTGSSFILNRCILTQGGTAHRTGYGAFSQGSPIEK